MFDVGRTIRSRLMEEHTVETGVGIVLIIVAALEIVFLIRVVQGNTPRA